MVRWRQRIGPVLALFFFAPISAEYLLGYDSLIGRPVELLVGLLIFGPLYGAPALLIREAARRAGRGWPTILLVSFAAGLAQAGLIDQSLFNPSYRDIPYWEAMRLPTYLPGFGFSAYMVLSFLGGHMMQSYAAPIAVIETLNPRVARQPWLGRPGLIVVTLLYLAAAGLVLVDQSRSENFVASAGQLIGSAVVVIALVVIAFRLPRGRRVGSGTSPRPGVVGVVAFVAIAGRDVLPTTWLGVAVAGPALIGLGALVWRWSGRIGWGDRHVLALAAAVLAVNIAMAFVIQPLGNPDAVVKYTVNAVLALGVAVLLVAGRKARTQPAPSAPEGASPVALCEGTERKVA